MGVNRDDVKLANGQRAPKNAATRKTKDEWNSMVRRFKPQPLSDAMAGFGVAKVRVR